MHEPAYVLDIAADDSPKPWTAIPFVADEINRRISGHTKRDCFDLLAWKYRGRSFEKALFLNRTDFTLEHRLYFELRLFKSAVALHERHLPLPEFNARFSNANASAVLGGRNGEGQTGVWFNALSELPHLAVWEPDLETAEQTWLRRHGGLLSESTLGRHVLFDLPIRRSQFTESGDLVEGPFDLVINYLGGQSLSYPDRVFRSICRHMTPDGVMLNFDYIGPHRYQYSLEQWEYATEINRQLPEHGRQNLVYPRLSALLERDPNDAIHSELTLATMKRYFILEHFRPAGGAIAQPVLSYNPKLFGLVGGLESILAEVLASDWDYLCEHPESTSLAYWTARPNHAVLEDREQLAKFTLEEERREETARRNGGCYYPQTPLHRALYPYDTWTSTMKDLRRKVRGLLRKRS